MSAIQPGDLAVVVRDCCGSYLGLTFVISAIEMKPFGALVYLTGVTVKA